jgi:hypothetical protein
MTKEDMQILTNEELIGILFIDPLSYATETI